MSGQVYTLADWEPGEVALDPDAMVFGTVVEVTRSGVTVAFDAPGGGTRSATVAADALQKPDGRAAWQAERADAAAWSARRSERLARLDESPR